MNTILTLVVLLILVAAFAVAIPALQQAVQAKGPPSKAQAILAAEPKQRGSVASGGQGGCLTCG